MDFMRRFRFCENPNETKEKCIDNKERRKRQAVLRKEGKMAASVGNDVLPEDIMLIILLRLPVKTLKRFTCVCKSWFATFQNPNFIRNHYITNTVTASNLKLMVQTMNPSSPITNSRNYGHYLSSSNPMTSEVSETINLSCFQYFNFRAMVECEGVICMYNARATIALFNPATRQVKLIPQPCIQHVGMLYALGIGYDYKTNDYKVVQLLRYYDNGAIYHVQLYSLSTNSWKDIHYALELNAQFVGIRYSNFSSTYLNGCYHWLKGGTKGILAFDMSQEVFKTMTFPAHLVPTTLPELSVFDGRLAFVFRSSYVRNCFEIYTMKEYGVEESWTKQLVIGPILGVEEILGSYRGGEQWVFSTHEHDTRKYQMKLYDNSTKMVKDLGTHFTAWEAKALIFTENLFSLENSIVLKKEDIRYVNRRKKRCGYFTGRFKQKLAPFSCFCADDFTDRARDEPLVCRHQSTGPMRLGYYVPSMTDRAAQMSVLKHALHVVGLRLIALSIETRTLMVEVEGSTDIFVINKIVKRALGDATTILRTYEAALEGSDAPDVIVMWL